MTDCLQTSECTPALLAHLKKPEIFKALCDVNRLTLLSRLATSTTPLTVTDASECCGIHISGVSRHLKILEQAGIVEAEKRGREVVYRVAFQPLISMLRGLADALEACCVPAEQPKQTEIQDSASA